MLETLGNLRRHLLSTHSSHALRSWKIVNRTLARGREWRTATPRVRARRYVHARRDRTSNGCRAAADARTTVLPITLAAAPQDTTHSRRAPQALRRSVRGGASAALSGSGALGHRTCWRTRRTGHLLADRLTYKHRSKNCTLSHTTSVV